MEDADVKELAARLRDTKLRRMDINPSRFPYERCPEQEKLDWEAIAREAIEALSPTRERDPAHRIAFGYTNWRGEQGIRQAFFRHVRIPIDTGTGRLQSRQLPTRTAARRRYDAPMPPALVGTPC